MIDARTWTPGKGSVAEMAADMLCVSQKPVVWTVWNQGSNGSDLQVVTTTELLVFVPNCSHGTELGCWACMHHQIPYAVLSFSCTMLNWVLLFLSAWCDQIFCTLQHSKARFLLSLRKNTLLCCFAHI